VPPKVKGRSEGRDEKMTLPVGTKRFIVHVEVDIDLDAYEAAYGEHETQRQVRDYVEGNVHSSVTSAFRHLDGARVRIQERRSR